MWSNYDVIMSYYILSQVRLIRTKYFFAGQRLSHRPSPFTFLPACHVFRTSCFHFPTFHSVLVQISNGTRPSRPVRSWTFLQEMKHDDQSTLTPKTYQRSPNFLGLQLTSTTKIRGENERNPIWKKEERKESDNIYCSILTNWHHGLDTGTVFHLAVSLGVASSRMHSWRFRHMASIPSSHPLL